MRLKRAQEWRDKRNLMNTNYADLLGDNHDMNKII